MLNKLLTFRQSLSIMPTLVIIKSIVDTIGKIMIKVTKHNIPLHVQEIVSIYVRYVHTNWWSPPCYRCYNYLITHDKQIIL